ncbi:hypothetical protein GE09DRAFT_284013 [Coniochaeta sp. 2T2.1]|nr:hypothetical protein GE09DRAFT_284013 [Coniochaeta sp. 2T2.1]
MGRDERPQQRQACDRCHWQKLRCDRETSDNGACLRCIKRRTSCTYSPPRKLGRPVKRLTLGLEQHSRASTSAGSSTPVDTVCEKWASNGRAKRSLAVAAMTSGASSQGDNTQDMLGATPDGCLATPTFPMTGPAYSEEQSVDNRTCTETYPGTLFLGELDLNSMLHLDHHVTDGVTLREYNFSPFKSQPYDLATYNAGFGDSMFNNSLDYYFEAAVQSSPSRSSDLEETDTNDSDYSFRLALLDTQHPCATEKVDTEVFELDYGANRALRGTLDWLEA